MRIYLFIILFFHLLLPSSIEINSTSYDDWVYINLNIGAIVVPSDPENNLGWDIACQRYHFRTNSGLSGSGIGGAYVDSVSTWTSELYSNLTKVPDNSFFEKDTVVNTFYSVIDTDGDGVDEHIFGLPGIANPSLETWGWIDINNNYTMNYTDNQFIVRSADGQSFYKLWAINYYNDDGTSGYITIYFENISPCSLGHDECGECDGNNECLDCEGIPNGNAVDTDGDGICDSQDDCPTIYNPYQHDRDLDGLADACEDNDDDGDGLLDCWGYWYSDGVAMAEEELLSAIESGDCEDYALAADNIFNPKNIRLSQNYPNPFNPSTTIEYSLKNPANITLDIFNVSGRKITMLDNGFKHAGTHRLIWDGLNSNGQKMPSGLYIYRLMLNGVEVNKKKMLLLY